MADCKMCGDDVSMPYECNLCGNQYCSDHRLPEKHDCPMLDRGGPDGEVVVEVEDQNEDDSGWRDLIPGLSGLGNRVDGEVNKIFGITIAVVYVLQIATLAVFGQEMHNFLFVLEPTNITHVWTWFTSIFAHSPTQLFHIIGNGIILFFFGSMVEKIIGSRDYALLFISAGVVAGLGQVLMGLAIGDPAIGVLGASGALLGVMGVLTVYKPDLTVHLYFILPVPLWVITGGYAVLSVVGILGGGGLGGIAHGAHLIGLIVGVMYGYRTRDKHSVNGSKRIGGELRR